MATQRGVTVLLTTLDRLVVTRDEASELLRWYGRVQTIVPGETGVPLVPFKAWISTLVMWEAHEANHEGVAGLLLRVRSALL